MAFDSGSTGVDGDFNPTVSTEVVLPPNGILNYRSVNIPSSVTVTFKRNATNTPVVMLVQGDVTIAGTIDISGKPGADVGPAGDGNRADDGTPGQGGPGGFDGGYGGPSDYDGGYHDAPEGALFGSRGLFNLRDPHNQHVHPLAQLTSVGKGLVDASIRNIGIGFGAQIGGTGANPSKSTARSRH